MRQKQDMTQCTDLKTEVKVGVWNMVLSNEKGPWPIAVEVREGGRGRPTYQATYSSRLIHPEDGDCSFNRQSS
jgi:hypothetical protein